MAYDPIKITLWGMLVGNIENLGILAAEQGGEAIARTLEGKDVIEKLANLDRRDDNFEFTDWPGYKLVVLKGCPFGMLYDGIPKWGEKVEKLIESYNKQKNGGGAIHPLCLVHKGVRKGVDKNIVSIGCRGKKSNRIEISEGALEKLGMSREEAEKFLEGKACLYAVKVDE